MENKTERKRKRRSCGGDAEGPKEKKSVLIDPEEHLRLLGVVTGQIQKLPLEDTQDECEVNTTTDTPAKRRKKKKRSGRDIPQNTKEAPNCEEKSAVDKASASEYLEQWDHDRTNWSFKKKTQYWLLQNMFFKAHLSKSNFTVMLRYLEGLQGNQRKLALRRAQDLMKEKELLKGEDPRAKWTYKRASKVTQVLSDSS